ncbi:MAG: hypothetical protein J5528_01025 [Firmicutes bacterium]|nr:hypothetical protein [Bacillota bacterium]
MKKILSLMLCASMIFVMAGCGKETGEWTRSGYFTDEAGDMLSITYMDDIADPGWYVGFMNGEDWVENSFGGTLTVKKGSLQGTLTSAGGGGDLKVTVTEEGEDGVLVKTKDAEYHLTPMEIPDVRFTVTINTEGMGAISYAAGTETPEFDPEEPYQWASFGIYDENVTYTIGAFEYIEGYHFVKWTKNGEDYTTEPQFTVDIDGDTEFVAVFEFQ